MSKIIKISCIAVVVCSLSCLAKEPIAYSPELLYKKTGLKYLKKNIKRNKDFAKAVLNSITAKTVSLFSTPVLDYLMQHNKVLNKKIKTSFSRAFIGASALEMYLSQGKQGAKALIKKWNYSQTKPTHTETTVSVKHFEQVFYKSNFLQKNHSNREIRNVYAKAILRQKIESAKGNYVAFHAQASGFPGLHMNVIFQELLGLYYGTPIKEEWWALRFAKPGTWLPYADGQEIIKNGPTTDDRDDIIAYKHFMNDALFGNTVDLIGSDTVGFFESNSNVGVKSSSVPDTIKDLFTIFGWKHYYKKYKDRFDVIQKAYEDKDKTAGILLVHVFSEQAWRDFVYYAAPLGWRLPIKINGEETHDPVEIYNAMQSKPESIDATQLDAHELVFIQTEDHLSDPTKWGSLNPFNLDIRTYHYTVEDYSDIKSMIKEVFALIKQDMQEETITN